MDKSADKRNLIDEFKGMEVADIKQALDGRRHELHIAVENLERDFNAGTIVRNANAFNVAAVHFIGKRQWNKRGAMATNLYMNVYYHPTIQDFLQAVEGYSVIGIDIVADSKPLGSYNFPKKSVLVFGSEGPGLSSEMMARCDDIVNIEQFGSTRSINVGVASGIAMYVWAQQHVMR